MVTFAFSPNSIRNATFSPHPNGQPLYTLSTDVRSNSKTTIANAQTGAVVAYIERNEILPDTVKFSGRNEGKKMRVSKWLVAGKTPDKFPVTFMETKLGRCIWKSDPSYRLALFRPDDVKYASPIAHIQNAQQQLLLLIDDQLFKEDEVVYTNDEQMVNLVDILAAVSYLEGKLRGGDRPPNIGQGMAQEALISTAMGTQ
ncbi:hypothetical protein PC9H_001668 [Pleurotus ostreatus]|uniref:DUF6593 domain-containing protein n=1 Tax=Pleurotus ostreatus TaxID=5322 RepID=A0A8H7DWE8_PLEOS|nr:uncharacterized protein PC9H_001668 [Pleurotus ostreatus]KAF7441319.1 hypothetical protein PC9H_001668 [Pleurotus ostreatus]KAJ8699143.1 hypothetical protein PTI98_002293 [Pleurotus ostreatus]